MSGIERQNDRLTSDDDRDVEKEAGAGTGRGPAVIGTETPPLADRDDEQHDAPTATAGAAVAAPEGTEQPGRGRRRLGFLRKAGSVVLARIELRGIAPIPASERTETRAVNVFTLWWSANFNILPITFGMLAPAFNLGLRDASLVILFFTLLTTTLPALLTTLGPKTGMRQMVQARYSWGRYAVVLPVLLNLATLTGFCVIMAVVGGQCIRAAAGANGGVTLEHGILIVALLAMVISFCGFKVLHFYERWASIPAVIAIMVATGCGGDGLKLQPPADEVPVATPQAVLTFGMIVASYMIPWAALASDFSTYLKPKTSSAKIFLYSYLGLAIPPILLMTLGAAIACALPRLPSWEEGYSQNLVGGVLDAMLSPAGGFGKFLVVVLALSLLGNVSATAYSITINLPLLHPWLLRVPRCVYSAVLTGIVIGISILVVARDFFLSLENFVALIGYWSSAFVSVLLVEHFWFRRGRCSTYDAAVWDSADKLPPGLAALGAFLLSFALVIPSMAQVWWTGPIAVVTGDIGFELAFVAAGVFYVPLRMLEKRKWDR